MGQDTSLYERKQFIDGNDTLQYRLLYPINFDVNKKYPVILFLHGKGERGNDNEKQLVHGAKLFSDSANRVKYPAFVIFPQCPVSDFWPDSRRETNNADELSDYTFMSDRPVKKSLGLVGKMIDSFSRTPQVNNKKIYVGGLSMGGMGTFEMLWRKPGFFAAAFPICGGGDPGKVSLYAKDFPIWVFHGGSDKTVLPDHSRRMVNSLKAAGAKVRYSEYPGVGHDSWTNAFAEPDLLKWLFEQKKK
jgi:predicted peptidase